VPFEANVSHEISTYYYQYYQSRQRHRLFSVSGIAGLFMVIARQNKAEKAATKDTHQVKTVG